jgi:hypothetical protein
MNESNRPVAVNGRKAADDALILALATGVSVPAAAQRAEVSERTAYRRLQDPAFRCRVTETRTALFAEAVGRLASLAGRAADTLGDLLASASDMVKLHAAKSVLELGPKLREAGEIAERLDALEREAAEWARGAPQLTDGTEADEAVDEAPPEANVGANI